MIGFDIWVIGIMKNYGYIIAIMIDYAGPVNMKAVSRSLAQKASMLAALSGNSCY